jgi:hypothetical protein
MNVDGMSTVQAAYAAILLTQGRERAESMFVRMAVAGGLSATWHAEALAALLSNGGLPAAVLAPAERDASRLYDLVKRTGWLAFGVWTPGNADGALVWGLTYQKPCKCAGLCFFLGDRERPHMATPHRNHYRGSVVVIRQKTFVHWPLLSGLPMLA